jgi:hypothetical protein
MHREIMRLHSHITGHKSGPAIDAETGPYIEEGRSPE